MNDLLMEGCFCVTYAFTLPGYTKIEPAGSPPVLKKLSLRADLPSVVFGYNDER
jgi:hypothetical protein